MFDEMSEAPHLRKKTEHLRAYIKLKACEVGGLTATYLGRLLGVQFFPFMRWRQERPREDRM